MDVVVSASGDHHPVGGIRTVTSLPVLTTMSALRSPFRSPRAIADGRGPTEKGDPGAARHPDPRARSTVTSLLAMFAVAMSPVPSASTSPMATAEGDAPTFSDESELGANAQHLVARKWTYTSRRFGRPGVIKEIRQLVVRMAEENPTWGYTRIRGALKNVGHRVERSTIARILKSQGLPPVPGRPTSWETFLRAHWGAIAGADFFTTEVWTWRGLVTYYTLFVIELATRRVQIVGSTPHPNDAFMLQAARTMTALDDGALAHCRVLICDRDRKWSAPVRQLLEESAVHVVQTPFQAPNCNAHAERFVRSIKEECLNRVIPLGERHFRTAMHEFVEHYHCERNHQGLDNEIIDGQPSAVDAGRLRRRQRLGGLLNYYCRAA